MRKAELEKKREGELESGAGFNSVAGGGRGQRTTLIILLSTTAEAPEMQTLLPHGNMMNFMALCLYEVSWTELIEVLKNSTGSGGNGRVCLRTRDRVSPLWLPRKSDWRGEIF